MSIFLRSMEYSIMHIACHYQAPLMHRDIVHMNETWQAALLPPQLITGLTSIEIPPTPTTS